MMPTALHEHIAAGESQTLECNTSFGKASIESLVAFANAQGGAVLVGIAELQKLYNAIEKCGSCFIRIRKAPKEYPDIDF